MVFQGRIEAKEIYLSAKIPTRLKSIEVKEGTSVKKGQLLATTQALTVLVQVSVETITFMWGGLPTDLWYVSGSTHT